jgi:hypothetical protein
MATCGRDAHTEKAFRVSKLPNLAYSLIVLEQHDLLMKLPIIRKAIMSHHIFLGDWFVRCLVDRQLMEKLVTFIEIVSNDIYAAHMNNVQIILDRRSREKGGGSGGGGGDDDDDDDDDDDEESFMKCEIFQRIAAIDNFVTPMLRLPAKLQDRLVSTQVFFSFFFETCFPHTYIYLFYILTN